MKRQILPSITTAGNSKHTWAQRLIELESLELKECAIFLTGLNKEERQVFYVLLEGVSKRTGLKVPFIHARSDMSVDEYRFLIDKFDTQAFNLHPARTNPLVEPLPAWLRKMIYIEIDQNSRPGDLRGYAGICGDISHFEDYRRQGWKEDFSRIKDMIQRFPIGATHISAVSRIPYVFKNGDITYAVHNVNAIPDLNYLRNYAKYFFGQHVALELDNSISEQLLFKKHIEQNIWRHQEVIEEESILIHTPSYILGS